MTNTSLGRGPATATVEADLADAVKAADPLSFDRWVPLLPELNRRGDVPALTALLADLTATVLETPGATASLVNGLAAMRDMGIVLGSLRRHETEPLSQVPDLEAPLQQLGKSSAMPPRDTILHYALWNPSGDRERTYTGEQQETALIDSVRMVFPDLPEAIATCNRLHGGDPRDPQFAVGLEDVGNRLSVLISSMQSVRSGVTPSFFTLELRPYLESVSVGGVSFYGPAAAQLPMWLIDQAILPRTTAVQDEESYEAFWRALVPYTIPTWRDHLAFWETGDSLHDSVVKALRSEGADVGTRNSALALSRVLRLMLQFRGVHLGIAQRAYDVEVEGGGFELGSGGGSIELLKEIQALTKRSVALASIGKPS